MRKLKTKDLFSLSRCLRKIGIKDEIKKIAAEAKSVQDVSEYGFDLVYRLFELATEKESEDAIFEFLSDIFEMPAGQVSDMELDDFFGNFKQIADAGTWKSFFTRAVSLMK